MTGHPVGAPACRSCPPPWRRARHAEGPGGCRTPLTREGRRSRRRPVPRLVFLGGVGEIGRNMAVLEMDGRILVLDCGLSFPHAEMPGIDLVLPTSSTCASSRTASRPSCSPTATRTTWARCPTCCASSAVCPSTGPRSPSPCSREARGARRPGPGRRARDRPGDADRRALLDALPPGDALDPRRGRGRRRPPARDSCTPGTSSSTRRPSTAGSPTSRAWPTRPPAGSTSCCPTPRTPRTRAYRQRANGRAGARGDHPRRPTAGGGGCFASHIHRIQQVVDAAVAAERKVAFLGRCMHQSVAAAARPWPPARPGRGRGPDRGPRGAGPVRRGRVLHRVAGRAAVGAVAHGRPRAQVGEARARRHGGAVVLDDPRQRAGHPPCRGRAVPGGGRGLPRPHDPGPRLGHAAAEELRFMLNLVRPRWFIPVHGELRHLAHHAGSPGGGDPATGSWSRGRRQRGARRRGPHEDGRRPG